MDNLLSYDLFIFDFDGTLMNTEEIHYLSWKNALNEKINKIIENNNFTQELYDKIFHSLQPNYSRIALELLFNITNLVVT